MDLHLLRDFLLRYHRGRSVTTVCDNACSGVNGDEGEAGEEAEGVSGLLLGVALDYALRQYLL